MMSKLTKDAYQKLIEENIEWLENNTEDCCERRHTIQILKQSIEESYVEDKECRCKEWEDIAERIIELFKTETNIDKVEPYFLLSFCIGLKSRIERLKK